tara:strand:- start:100 stop:321 length:222 start_codon:yes stop_codon:yes gene_type:complete
MAILKNSKDKSEFVTEIYLDGEEEPAVVTSSPREIDAIDDAMYEFGKLHIDAGFISRIETWAIPQHYTADELA